jgi:superfamily II DNA or RNA helicase
MSRTGIPSANRVATAERDARVEPQPASSFVPCIRLFADHVLVTRSEGLSSDCDEQLLPLIALDFDYAGTRVRASDEHERLFRSDGGALVSTPRDLAGEAQARRTLERLGAVELALRDDLSPLPGCEADYTVRPGGDAHALCAFTAEALPQLRALGWQVRVADDYPFQVVTAAAAAWFAAVEPDPELPGWFNFDLGVEVEGARVDLLPLVLELLGDSDGQDLRSLERRFRSSYALRVGDRRYVTVSAERLAGLVRVVIELYHGEQRKPEGRIGFPQARAAALANLDAAFRETGAALRWRDPAKVVQSARKLVARPAPVGSPPTLRASLRPYQQEGVAFLQHLRASGVGGVLADDMGLGKTLQTIAHICIEKAAGRLRAPVLIVTPKSLVGNWMRELQRFAPHLRVLALAGASRHERYPAICASDVVLTTYPLLVRDEERLMRVPFHLLVLDEAQSIKNERSQAHRAIKSLEAEHRLCLTGTPVENHLGELWALFDFLNPGLLGDALSFRRWYRQPIEIERDQARLLALREQIAPYVLRRMKRDVARDLPPKSELASPVELSGRQRELYESIRVAAHADVRQIIHKKGLAASTIPILDALMKLRQVCCDPALVAMEEARTVRESAKRDALFAMLGTQLAEGHRVLVFSQFASMLALLAAGLRERGVPHLMLTGATRDRQQVVDAFEAGRADVFLISLKAGGTGLNLTSADTVIHYDPWWNPAAQAQATDRAYRIGQSRPVFVHNLYVAGSVEERVLRLQQRKRWLSTTLLGDASQGAPALTHEDVESLFAPLEDGEECRED